ncbi:hypothetical protein J6590_090719 [Homalodisca vitripennis]|nr:hypothetical protein J6590_090719 [Homalodisca vitripennis]
MPRSNRIFKRRKPISLGNRRVQIIQQDILAGSDCGPLETSPRPNLMHLNETLQARRKLAEICQCTKIFCNQYKEEMNSPIVCSGKAELNIRLAYAARRVGLGDQGGRTFCGIMNMAPSQFRNHTNVLSQAIKEIEKKCRQSALLARRRLEDEYEDEEDPDNPSYGSGKH